MYMCMYLFPIHVQLHDVQYVHNTHVHMYMYMYSAVHDNHFPPVCINEQIQYMYCTVGAPFVNTSFFAFYLLLSSLFLL